MAYCLYCQRKIERKGSCPNCGNLIIGNFNCTVHYGLEHKDKVSAKVTLTSRYLLIQRFVKEEIATTFLLGAFASSAIHKEDHQTYGFYDLAEISKVIYPFINADYKKSTCKIINKDGSDIIIFMSPKIIENMGKLGIPIEDGSATNYGAQWCVKPFVDQKTYATRICPSAAPFVIKTSLNIDVPSVSGMSYFTPQEQDVSSSVPNAQYANRFCTGCGNPLSEGVRFCVNCGKKVGE